MVSSFPQVRAGASGLSVVPDSVLVVGRTLRGSNTGFKQMYRRACRTVSRTLVLDIVQTFYRTQFRVRARKDQQEADRRTDLGRVGVVESTPRRHLTLVPTGDGSPPADCRLTRRGRLAITLVVLALAVTAAVVGVNRAFAAPAAAAPLATVTVASGDTLSAIAAREMPGLPSARPSSASRSPTTSTPPPSAPARASSSRVTGVPRPGSVLLPNSSTRFCSAGRHRPSRRWRPHS